MAVVHEDPQPQLPGNGDIQENPQDLLSPLPTPGKHALSCEQALVERGVVCGLTRGVTVAAPSNRDFRDIQVKVHIRRPEKDSWMYLGRGVATQEVQGHSSRVGECQACDHTQSPSRCLMVALRIRHICGTKRLFSGPVADVGESDCRVRRGVLLLVLLADPLSKLATSPTGLRSSG